MKAKMKKAKKTPPLNYLEKSKLKQYIRKNGMKKLVAKFYLIIFVFLIVTIIDNYIYGNFTNYGN